MIEIRSARAMDLPGVAAVLREAFSDKMRVIFGGQPHKVQTLLEAMYAGPIQRGYDGIFVAEQDGRIVGTLVVQPVYYTAQENRIIEGLAARELGLPRMLWASFALWLVSHTPNDGEAYVSDVAVAPEVQGQGIGSRLMQHAEHWAYSHSQQRLTLWVAATNPGAIHVYEKAGYSIQRTRTNLLTRLVYGIRKWHFMEKTVNLPLKYP